MFDRDKHTRGHNDHDEKDDDSNNDANSHLHVFPPHLLPDSVGTSSKALCRDGQIVSLVLKAIELFTTASYCFEISLDHINRFVDFLRKVDISRMPTDK